MFKFSDNDINKFILLLREGVYPYECMHDWERFNETTLLEKEECYRNLNGSVCGSICKWKKLQMQITCMRKEFVKTLK